MKKLEEIEIEEIEEIEYDDYVYTLEVEDNHNYFINSGTLSKNSVVLIDEVTNFPRYEVRTILTRMGENVKCICTGDTRQIDNTHLNSENNGLNWIIKYLTGYENYGHITLKGRKSRGPITDIVRKSGL